LGLTGDNATEQRIRGKENKSKFYEASCFEEKKAISKRIF
jgi:hypothetical protein